jgi:pilus assembly protein CpaE
MKRLSGRWKHLIICPDRGLLHGLTAILVDVTPGSPFTDLKAYPARRALADLVNLEKPNLCFLDVGSSWDSAVAMINELSSIDPTIPVVAISGGNDPDIILRSLRQGASEFLFQPFAIDQVGAALDRLMRVRSDSAGGPLRDMGKIYGVVPGKGASGASTLACNLAFQLQKLNPERKLLLSDLDMATGTVSFLLKLKSSFSFVDALTHASQMDEDLWKGLVVNHRGIDVMLCPENPVENMPAHEAGAMIDYARENYGAVVLDLAGPYGELAEQTVRQCDLMFLVTTNELPALHATQRAIAHLESNGLDRTKIRLVVNRYDSNQGLDKSAIETALQLEIFQILPNDADAVQKSLLEGKPVASNSNLGKCYINIATQLDGGRKTEPKVKRSSLLSGIFSAFDGVLHKG